MPLRLFTLAQAAAVAVMILRCAIIGVEMVAALVMRG